VWFEDRITALSEALAMDANKPTGANTADDNKPLSERQLDLALLVQKMNLNGQGSKPNSRTGSRVRVDCYILLSACVFFANNKYLHFTFGCTI